MQGNDKPVEGYLDNYIVIAMLFLKFVNWQPRSAGVENLNVRCLDKGVKTIAFHFCPMSVYINLCFRSIYKPARRHKHDASICCSLMSNSSQCKLWVKMSLGNEKLGRILVPRGY